MFPNGSLAPWTMAKVFCFGNELRLNYVAGNARLMARA